MSLLLAYDRDVECMVVVEQASSAVDFRHRTGLLYLVKIACFYSVLY